MKFTLVITAAAGAIAAPYVPSVSVPSHSVSVPAHSVSVPAYAVPSYNPEEVKASVISWSATTPSAVPELEERDNEEHEHSSSVSIPAHTLPSAVPSVPEHTIPVHEEETAAPLSPLAKTLKDLTTLIVEIKELVSGDVELIKSILSDPTSVIPTELTSAVSSLKAHLEMILKIVVPRLLALLLKLTTVKITQVDIQAVLSLLDEVKFILKLVESCVEDLVAELEADVLKLVAKELKTVLDLVLTTAGPVVKFVLAVVSTVNGLTGLVDKVTTVVGEIEVVEGLVEKVLALLPVEIPL
ncbi:hypothetical protein B0T14DRAFT_563828 [Immersiella caudata]|uniref:Uncharacterized protein n=1 Tax=Immersiella caudata TaxID=314043 RepID=A0AA40C1Z5_9PEZI|nr:hypothetical protein B0T14DRAFT_563828 [Immersiella caudata]